MKILFALDPRSYVVVQNGVHPIIPYSHDRNLLMFAHECLWLGHEVFLSSGVDGMWSAPILSVAQVYPAWITSRLRIDPQSMDCIFSAGADQLRIRPFFPKTKLVGVLSALHMFESPALHGPGWAYNYLTAVRDHLDCIVTLNPRMKEIFNALCVWLAKVDFGERILVAPLGFNAQEAQDLTASSKLKLRSELNISPLEIVFANAGGTWGWTDCDTFLTAMCHYINQNPGSRFRILFSGITQPDNEEKNPVADNIISLMTQYPDLFSEKIESKAPIYVERNWGKGSEIVRKMLSVADIGINVSKKSLESWQSNRVRFVDYLTYRLPVLNTSGDIASDLNGEACITCEAGNIEGYIKLFEEIASNPLLLETKRAGAAVARSRYMSSNIVPPILEQIEKLPLRTTANETKESWFYDTLIEWEMSQLRGQLDARLNAVERI